MRQSVLVAAAVGAAVLALTSCGDGGEGAVVEESTAAAEAGAASRAVLRDPEGAEVGTV